MPAAPARAVRLARDLAAGPAHALDRAAPARPVPTYRGEGRCFG